MRISDWSSDVCSSDLAAYDRFGHEAFKNGGFNGNGQGAGGFSDLGDIFETIFGSGGFGGGGRQQNRRGADLRYDLEISLEEAFQRSEEHTSELQSLMRISYAVFCLKKKNRQQ